MSKLLDAATAGLSPGLGVGSAKGATDPSSVLIDSQILSQQAQHSAALSPRASKNKRESALLSPDIEPGAQSLDELGRRGSLISPDIDPHDHTHPRLHTLPEVMGVPGGGVAQQEGAEGTEGDEQTGDPMLEKLRGRFSLRDRLHLWLPTYGGAYDVGTMDIELPVPKTFDPYHPNRSSKSNNAESEAATEEPEIGGGVSGRGGLGNGPYQVDVPAPKGSSTTLRLETVYFTLFYPTTKAQVDEARRQRTAQRAADRKRMEALERGQRTKSTDDLRDRVEEDERITGLVGDHPLRQSWVPSPLSDLAAGYASFAKMGIFGKWALTAAAYLTSFTVLPAYMNAPLAVPSYEAEAYIDPQLSPADLPPPALPGASLGGMNESTITLPGAGGKRRKFPLVIFSHGLAGTRTGNSQYCGQLASRGYVVAAMEHRDGSGPSTHINVPPKEWGKWGSGGEEEDDEGEKTRHLPILTNTDSMSHDHTPEDLTSRSIQVHFRILECFALLHAFQSIWRANPTSSSGSAGASKVSLNEASTSASTAPSGAKRAPTLSTYNLRKPGTPGIPSGTLVPELKPDSEDWKNWLEGVDVEDQVAISGHSFGAGTVLSAFQHPSRPSALKAGIALDPGVYDIYGSQIGDGTSVPVPSLLGTGSLAREPEPVTAPILVINSPGFTSFAERFRALRLTLAKSKSWIMTVGGTSHVSYTDFPLLVGIPDWVSTSMRWWAGYRAKKKLAEMRKNGQLADGEGEVREEVRAIEPQRAMDLYTDLSEEFLRGHGVGSRGGEAGVGGRRGLRGAMWLGRGTTEQDQGLKWEDWGGEQAPEDEEKKRKFKAQEKLGEWVKYAGPGEVCIHMKPKDA